MTHDPDDTLTLSILKELRTESRQHRDLLLQLIEANRRLERRIGESRDEIELMLKGELLGRFAHFETQIDERFAELEARLSAPH